MITRRELLAGAVGAMLNAIEGSTLVHEHVLVDFGGMVSPGRYDRDEVFRLARPKLEEVRKLGCRCFLDCTPNYLGRDSEMLARLSDAVGLEICTNTGIYGAADRKGVPAFVRDESAAQLAKRFIAEAVDGVGGMKPRFIKTGVATAPLDELDHKLVRAAAIASRETGLTVASHTGRGRAALDQLDIFAAEKVSAEKFVWVHAQNEKDHAIHEKVARVGSWVEFDAFREGRSDWQRDCVRWMAEHNLLGRTLIANDSGWYHVGEPGGGDFAGYAFIYTGFLPMLAPSWRYQLMVTNPKAAFGIK
jgi:phosphotriesterase-related protein